MNQPGSALTFLLLRSTRNRVLRQAQRLRRPKYAIGFIIAIAYFYFIFWQQSSGLRAARATGIGGSLMGIGEGVLLITVGLWWFARGAAGALAFQPAEVQMLFPAPLSRRNLVLYKIGKSQLVLLLNAMIWALLLRRAGIDVPFAERFLAAWGLFSVLSLHRTGLAMLLVEPRSRARTVALLIGRLFFVTAIAIIVAGLLPALRQFSSLPLDEAMASLSAGLKNPLTTFVLQPFHALLAPAYPTIEWPFLPAFVVVAGMVLLHFVWLLSLKVAFEDSAASASAKLADAVTKVRRFQSGAAPAMRSAKVTETRIPLAPTGHPGAAIVWKNTIALFRTRMLMPLLVPLIVMTVILGFAEFSRGDVSEGASSGSMMMFALMLFILGPRLMRNDLRQDMLSLASLKAFPLSGTSMIAAQLTSPTLVLSAIQMILLIGGAALIPAEHRQKIPAFAMMGMVIVVPVVVVALTALNMAIQNAAVLVFPAWTRIGPDSGGIDAMGQNMMLSFGSIFALMLLLILPIGLAIATVPLGSLIADVDPWASGLIGGVLCAVLLILELMLMVRWMGGVFERLDPTGV